MSETTYAIQGPRGLPGPTGPPGPGGPPGTPLPTGFTARIAASDASAASKSVADLVCNGTSDEVEINAAIAALPTPGGAIELSEGTFKTLAPIVVNKDNVTLRGQGAGYYSTSGDGRIRGGTLILPQASFVGTRIIDFSIAGRVLWNSHIRDLVVNGASASGTSAGIYYSVARGFMQSVYLANITGDGVVSYTDTFATPPKAAFDATFDTVEVINATGHGFRFSNGSSDNKLINCTARQIGGDGFAFDAGSENSANLLLGCFVFDCFGAGVRSGVTWGQRFIGCRIRDTNGGIYLTTDGSFGGGNLQIIGCNIRNSSCDADNTYDAINIAPGIATPGANLGVITGNSFSSGSSSYSRTPSSGSADSNRARYSINLANSFAKGVIVGHNAYTYRSPATAAYATAKLNDAGAGTQNYETAPRTLGQSAVAASHTGDAVETTLATVTVPGGAMGANGRLVVTTVWSYTNSANNKTLKVKLGANSFLSVNQTTTATYRNQVEIANRNATNSQVGQAAGLINGFGTSTGALVTSSVDTTNDQTVTITGTLANTGETVTLEYYRVEIIPG